MRQFATVRPFIVVGFALLLLMTFLPVAQGQANTVCLQCHTPQPGKGGAPVKAWRGSIHEENGISCHNCHGGDPKDSANAMSPARGFLGVPTETGIPQFCGRCHVGILDEYLKSAHGMALGKGGPTCVTCHGSHSVMKATLELINEKSCSRCHTYERAAAIKEAMRQTEGLISEIGRKIDRFKGEGVDTDAQEKSLFAMRNRYHRLFHNVDTDKVKGESGQIRQQLGTIDQALAEIDERNHRRKIAGAFVVAGLLTAALLFYLLKRTFDDSP